jgi:hypothetical protein
MKDLNTAFLKWIVQFAEIKALELNSSSKNNKTSVEAETDKLLVRYFGKCDQTLPGCVGKDPEVIRQAFKDGNLREQFYLSWNPAIRFLIDHFDEQNACLSSSFTNRELRSLAKRKPVAKRIIQYCDELNYGKDPLDRGRFARANKYFKKHRKTEKYTKDIGSSLIPLSEREKNGPSSDPANWTRGFSFQQAVPKNELDLTQPGFPDPMNLYYHTAKKFGFRTEVAMSGSTDAILNLASILGIQNKDRDLLIASAGYMITHKHHTIYEVLIGARSFGDVKDIPLNSDYYKYMSPDPKFAEKVEKIYKAQGFAQLPTEIYEKCLKEKLAQNRNLPTPSNNCTKPNEPDTILYLKNGLKSVLRFQR